MTKIDEGLSIICAHVVRRTQGVFICVDTLHSGFLTNSGYPMIVYLFEAVSGVLRPFFYSMFTSKCLKNIAVTCSTRLSAFSFIGLDSSGAIYIIAFRMRMLQICLYSLHVIK